MRDNLERVNLTKLAIGRQLSAILSKAKKKLLYDIQEAGLAVKRFIDGKSLVDYNEVLV